MATASCTFSIKFWLDFMTKMLTEPQPGGRSNAILHDTLRSAVADELVKTFDLPILPLPDSPTTSYHTAAAGTGKPSLNGKERSLAHFSWRVAQSLWRRLFPGFGCPFTQEEPVNATPSGFCPEINVTLGAKIVQQSSLDATVALLEAPTAEAMTTTILDFLPKPERRRDEPTMELTPRPTPEAPSDSLADLTLSTPISITGDENRLKAKEPPFDLSPPVPRKTLLGAPGPLKLEKLESSVIWIPDDMPSFSPAPFLPEKPPKTMDAAWTDEYGHRMSVYPGLLPWQMPWTFDQSPTLYIYGIHLGELNQIHGIYVQVRNKVVTLATAEPPVLGPAFALAAWVCYYLLQQQRIKLLDSSQHSGTGRVGPDFCKAFEEAQRNPSTGLTKIKNVCRANIMAEAAQWPGPTHRLPSISTTPQPLPSKRSDDKITGSESLSSVVNKPRPIAPKRSCDQVTGTDHYSPTSPLSRSPKQARWR